MEKSEMQGGKPLYGVVDETSGWVENRTTSRGLTYPIPTTSKSAGSLTRGWAESLQTALKQVAVPVKIPQIPVVTPEQTRDAVQEFAAKYPGLVAWQARVRERDLEREREERARKAEIRARVERQSREARSRDSGADDPLGKVPTTTERARASRTGAVNDTDER